MKEQLKLIESNPSWRIDDRTKAVGRDGIERARAALAAARKAGVELDRAA